MLRRNTTRASVVLAVLFIFLAVVAECSVDSLLKEHATGQCSRKCVAEDCDVLGIKYGKYCGIGYTGCPGEKPCDDLDACCMHHDECVGKFGMTHVKCHEKLRKCLKKAKKSGKPGFSKECPASTAASTMISGMDLAIMLSSFDKPVKPVVQSTSH